MSKTKLCSEVYRLLSMMFVFLVLTSPTIAQEPTPDSCETLVAQALAAIGDYCDDLDRNSACYGHFRVDASFYEEADGLRFDAPADRVALTDLYSVSTAPYVLEDAQWGVALLSVQANLPETLPGQAVRFVLMGDTTIRDNTAPSPEQPPVTPVEATVNGNSNLRSGPGTNFNIAGSAAAGDALVLIATNQARDWFQINLEDGTTAWIWRNLFTADDAALAELPVAEDVSLTTAPAYGPMQAFTLTTGVGLPDCNAAPNALLVRTPENTEVALRVNDLNVTIGSTVLFFITDMNPSEPTGQLGIAIVLIEGDAVIRTPNGTYTDRLRMPGDSVVYSLDEDGLVSENTQHGQYASLMRNRVNRACDPWEAANLVPEQACDYLQYPGGTVSLNPLSSGSCDEMFSMGRPLEVELWIMVTVPAGANDDDYRAMSEGFRGFAGELSVDGVGIPSILESLPSPGAVVTNAVTGEYMPIRPNVHGLWLPPAPGVYTVSGTITGSSYAGLSKSCTVTIVEE